MRLWLLLAVACAACSIEERSTQGTEPDTKLDLENTNDSIRVELLAPANARAGDAVPIMIVVQNIKAQPIDLALGGREIAFDIVVSHQDAVVWQRLFGKVVPAILQLKTLQPGESFQLKDVWQADVEPGTYEIVGHVMTDGDPLDTRPATISIGRR